MAQFGRYFEEFKVGQVPSRPQPEGWGFGEARDAASFRVRYGDTMSQFGRYFEEFKLGEPARPQPEGWGFGEAHDAASFRVR